MVPHVCAGIMPFAYNADEGELYIAVSMQTMMKTKGFTHIFTFLGASPA